MKPYRLRRWRPSSSSRDVEFFTCARPGRSGKPESKLSSVPDNVVHQWVRGLPGSIGTVIIVSLLGRKHGPSGGSEFSFYSFHGVWDRPTECRGRPSFQEWLDRWHRDRSIQVLEHPTYDYCRVPPETLDAVATDILRLASAGRVVCPNGLRRRNPHEPSL
jgi:hypothetical protein